MSTLWLKKQRLKCPLSAGFGFPDIYVTSWWHKIVLLCYLKIIFFCQNTVESEWNKSKKSIWQQYIQWTESGKSP